MYIAHAGWTKNEKFGNFARMHAAACIMQDLRRWGRMHAAGNQLPIIPAHAGVTSLLILGKYYVSEFTFLLTYPNGFRLN